MVHRNYTKRRKMLATMVWCSFSSELCGENSCRGVSGWPQGIRASARPLWCTCQVHLFAWLHDFHENILLCLWVPGSLQPDEIRLPQVFHVLKSLSLLHVIFLWRASWLTSTALFMHGWNILKGKQRVLEMVPILYFSVVTRGNIIIFGYKFLGMAQKACEYSYVHKVHSFSWTDWKYFFDQSN